MRAQCPAGEDRSVYEMKPVWVGGYGSSFTGGPLFILVKNQPKPYSFIDEVTYTPHQ